MTRRFDVLVVGAGQGGAQVAISLRQRGFGGTIALVGDEPAYPYERPPLSKEYLAGEKPFERLLIRPPAFWAERGIEVLTDHRVIRVDPSGHLVQTADKGSLGYGMLVWAAGGYARQLNCAGHSLAGVHSVRSRADVDRLTAELPATRRVCVVGGGYIGLEAAAVLAKLGKEVTIIEAQDRVLARVAGPLLSGFYEAQHRAHGADIRLGVTVERVEGSNGRTTGVRLANGEELPCEMVLVGIGITPAVEPLIEAGAAGSNGVVVDDYGRTSLTDIYALGDCAQHKNAFADGQIIRLESVQNANDMAATVARAITGTFEPYVSVPWFWSNQYDLKLQTVGLSTGYDDEVVRGDPSSRSFSVLYLKNGCVVAVDCVNAVKDYVAARALVTNRTSASAARLADPAVPLREA